MKLARNELKCDNERHPYHLLTATRLRFRNEEISTNSNICTMIKYHECAYENKCRYKSNRFKDTL